MRRAPRSIGAVVLLSAPLVGQAAAGMLTVGSRHEVPSASRRAIAWTSDARAFVALRRMTEGGEPGSLDLFELTARDGPREVGVLPTAQPVGPYAMVADRRMPLLHVVTSEKTAGGATSVFWRSFDLRRQSWRDRVVCLSRGTGPEDAYAVEDVEVTDSGALVVALSCHRRPPNPPWPRGWSTALRVLEPGAEEWGELVLVNPGGTGVCASLASAGEVVHVSYRNVTEGCGIYHRAYDLAAGRWLEDGDQKVSGDDLQSSNFSALVVDGSGGIWTAYSVGEVSGGKGRVEIAYRAPGGTDWSRLEVAGDGARRGGNFSEDGVTLANGPGDHVVALWSRIDEGQRRLYRRAFAAGQPIGPIELVADAAEGMPAFQRVVGARTTHHFGTVHAIVSGTGGGAGPVRVIAPRWPLRVVPR